MKYSFKQFCENTNNIDLINLWDDELNNISADLVSSTTTKKYWFKCPNGTHDSRLISVGNVVNGYKNRGFYCICHACNSIGQYIIDNYGIKYLERIWSDKNEKSYYDIDRSSATKIWLRCLDDNTHDDYDITAYNFSNGHQQCPYCTGQRVCLTNSFGYRHPEYVKVWSDKNNFGPFDRTYGSRDYAWFKCENGIHDEYKKQIRDINQTTYICPECAKIKAISNIPRGELSPQWRGGVLTETTKIRNSTEYAEWRLKVFQKDWFTCQCCGGRNKIQAHHLKSFSKHKELRLDVGNGMCLCENCHAVKIDGSFHNLYGTFNKTPEELEEYINNKRQQLGINIPFSLESYLAGDILKPGDISSNENDPFENTPWIFNLIEEENNLGIIAVQK